MIRYDINDTIAAIATAVGESGIGIVRISGKDALAVADKIFVSKNDKKPSDFKTYTTHYGWIAESHASEQKNAKRRTQSAGRAIIDEVILTIMRAPKSYTKEDIVEINCHGGIVAMRQVLALALENGCRLAQPGEFTKRAFLNGRIDLAQAEAVLDIIRAKTDSALRIGAQTLKGALSCSINQMRDALLDMLSVLEANIDFPEEKINLVNLGELSERLSRLDDRLKEILEGAKQGRILREGMHVVICGRPNVGKSSLLNALLKQERSIVSPIPGTTRDTIEELIDIKGIPIRIVDTAGIIEPRDLIEKKAVQRSKRYISAADLVVLLFDGSKRLSREDGLLIKKLKKKPAVAIINKIDLKQRIERDKIAQKFKNVIDISAKNTQNINLLEDTVAHLVYNGKLNCSEPILVSSLRHIEALKQAQEFIAKALNSLDNKLSLEFIAEDIKGALGRLDDILGKGFSEDLLDKIFNEFCIGK